MTPKLIISSIFGIASLGGAFFGCYKCFKPKDNKQTKSLVNNPIAKSPSQEVASGGATTETPRTQ